MTKKQTVRHTNRQTVRCTDKRTVRHVCKQANSQLYQQEDCAGVFMLVSTESVWQVQSPSPKSEARAGLQDNVPDRSSAMVAPAGCQLATMALKLKLSLSQKVGCMAESVKQSGTSVRLGWVARDWQTFCYLGSQSAGTLSCNPDHEQASLPGLGGIWTKVQQGACLPVCSQHTSGETFPYSDNVTFPCSDERNFPMQWWA